MLSHPENGNQFGNYSEMMMNFLFFDGDIKPIQQLKLLTYFYQKKNKKIKKITLHKPIN